MTQEQSPNQTDANMRTYQLLDELLGLPKTEQIVIVKSILTRWQLQEAHKLFKEQQNDT